MPKKNSNLHNMVYKNRYSLLSLIIILAMYLIVSMYYAPDSAVRVGASALTSGETGDVGGSFEMTTQTGEKFTNEMLQDKITLLFFGFTNCPDICPSTLGKLANVYEGIPKKTRKHLQVIFVTLDPIRDTRPHLNEYMNAFHEDFIALRGTEKQTREITKNYAIYHVKGPTNEHGDYNIDHTAHIYLMNNKGKYKKHFKHETSGRVILQETMIALNAFNRPTLGAR